MDAIVVSTASDSLTEDILKNAEEPGPEKYYQRREQDSNRSICINGGKLKCKRIYFIPCPKLSRNAHKSIFENFVSEAIKLALKDTTMTIQSLAFPAIGCGGFRCNRDFIAKTLIAAVAYEFKKNPSLKLSIYFTILNYQSDIFDKFMSELKALKSTLPSNIVDETGVTLTHLPKILQRNNSDKNGFTIRKQILDNRSDDYNAVIKIFYKTMPSELCKKILRVENIVNKRWFEQYETHSKAFYQRLNKNTEKRLFHGCSEDAAKSIINGNFDRSYAGQHGEYK